MDFAEVDRQYVSGHWCDNSCIADRYNKQCFFCFTSCFGFFNTEKTIKLCAPCTQAQIGKSIIFSPLMVHGYDIFFNDFCDLCTRKYLLEEHKLEKVQMGYVVPCCNFDKHISLNNCDLLRE